MKPERRAMGGTEENCEPAQVIVSIVEHPEAFRVEGDLREGAAGLRFEDDLASFVQRAGGTRAVELEAKSPSRFLLLTAPDGDVAGAVNRVTQRYAGIRSDHGPLVRAEPNHRARYETTSLGTPFTLGGEHDAYLDQMGVSTARAHGYGGEGVTVAVIDTGIEYGSAVDAYHDLIEGGASAVQGDEDGHGTAMAALIGAVAPDAMLCVVRASHASSPLLFEVMAGISIAVFDYGAAIVNLSLSLESGSCASCGASSASALQEHVGAVSMVNPAEYGARYKPIFIAAVGNQYDVTAFRDPAARRGVLAVGAVNRSGMRSRFSNYGTRKPEHLMAPGGDTDDRKQPTEYVGEGSRGGKCYGTSVSTAYASGMLALLTGTHIRVATETFVDHVLKRHCVIRPAQSSDEYGCGALSFVAT